MLTCIVLFSFVIYFEHRVGSFLYIQKSNIEIIVYVDGALRLFILVTHNKCTSNNQKISCCCRNKAFSKYKRGFVIKNPYNHSGPL